MTIDAERFRDGESSMAIARARRHERQDAFTMWGWPIVATAPSKEFVLAGSLEELKAKGRLVLRGSHRPILVIYDCGRGRNLAAFSSLPPPQHSQFGLTSVQALPWFRLTSWEPELAAHCEAGI